MVDLNLEKEVNVQDLGSDCDYSIYEGMRLKGWPIMTILRGNIMMEHGKKNNRYAGYREIYFKSEGRGL